MYFTGFILDTDSNAYYESIFSFKQDHAPIFKLRCVKNHDGSYDAIIRDYKTGFMVANHNQLTLDKANQKCIEMLKAILEHESKILMVD